MLHSFIYHIAPTLANSFKISTWSHQDPRIICKFIVLHTQLTNNPISKSHPVARHVGDWTAHAVQRLVLLRHHHHALKLIQFNPVQRVFDSYYCTIIMFCREFNCETWPHCTFNRQQYHTFISQHIFTMLLLTQVPWMDYQKEKQSCLLLFRVKKGRHWLTISPEKSWMYSLTISTGDRSLLDNPPELHHN